MKKITKIIGISVVAAATATVATIGILKFIKKCKDEAEDYLKDFDEDDDDEDFFKEEDNKKEYIVIHSEDTENKKEVKPTETNDDKPDKVEELLTDETGDADTKSKDKTDNTK